MLISTGTASIQTSLFSYPPKIVSFDPVLCFCRLFRLPLHVARFVSAVPLQRNTVIDHVSGTHTRSLACSRAGMTPLRGSPGSRVPLILPFASRSHVVQGVKAGSANPSRVARRVVAGFGTGGAVSSRFAPGNAATRAATPSGGGADADGGDD